MDAENKEFEKIHQDICDDVKALVEKYVSVTSWDVPENNEDKAREKIIQIIKETIKDM